jgi:hypothetical protein
MKKRNRSKFKPGDLVWRDAAGVYKRRSPERVLLGHVVQVLARKRVVIEMLNSPPKKSSPSPLDTPPTVVYVAPHSDTG